MITYSSAKFFHCFCWSISIFVDRVSVSGTSEVLTTLVNNSLLSWITHYTSELLTTPVKYTPIHSKNEYIYSISLNSSTSDPSFFQINIQVTRFFHNSKTKVWCSRKLLAIICTSKGVAIATGQAPLLSNDIVSGRQWRRFNKQTKINRSCL